MCRPNYSGFLRKAYNEGWRWRLDGERLVIEPPSAFDLIYPDFPAKAQRLRKAILKAALSWMVQEEMQPLYDA